MTIGVEKLKQEQIMAAMIVKSLKKSNVITPTVIDLSAQFAKGKTKASIPSAGDLAVETTPRDGNSLEGSNRVYDKSPLEIDIYKTVSDYLYDLDDHESMLDLFADFYADAPGTLAEALETDVVSMMREAGLASAKKFQLAGTSNQKITLAQITDLNTAMNIAKVPKEGRVLAVSPTQAGVIRAFPEVRDASASGSTDSIRNGFVARIEGFDVVESNDLTQYEVMAYHRSAACYGVGKEVKKDEQREASKKRTFVSVDGGWGMRVIRDLIWFGNEEA